MKKNVEIVKLNVEGSFCANYCGECIFLDRSTTNGKGEYYCPKMHEGSFWSYVDAGEKACRHFVPR